MRIISALVLLLVAPVPLVAGEQEDLEAALALQRSVKRVVDSVESSVACVLVSRSPAYDKLSPPQPDRKPGALGKVDVEALRERLRGTATQRRQALIDLDLAHPKHVPESYGCGVVLDGSGLVVTLGHVVDGATKIYVRLPGNRGSYADVHALDPRSDLAVLRLLDKVPQLKPVKMGDGDALAKGNIVIQVTNPFNDRFGGATPDFSWGIVSNVRQKLPPKEDSPAARNEQSIHEFGTLLAVDAKVRLNCSGGGLFDLKGELVGLTTSYALGGDGSPECFAIPLDAGIRRIVTTLLQGKEVEYGFLGVSLSNPGIPPFGAQGRGGVALQGVSSNSPAARAGLRGGDVVVRIDGREVVTDEDLFLLVGTGLAGGTIDVEVRRLGEVRPLETKVTLGKYWVPLPFLASNRPPARGGVRVDYSTIASQRSRRRWLNDRIPDGVIVREVVPGSAADKALLQENDIITHVDGHPVQNPTDYYRAMKAATKQATLSVRGLQGRIQSLTLNLEKDQGP